MSNTNEDKVNFDKFMDDIVLQEERKRAAEKRGEDDHEGTTPQREYIKRYSETPDNRIRYGDK